MSATRDGLVARVKTGGFDYLLDADVQRFVSEAAREVCAAENWLWRKRQATMSALDLRTASTAISGVISQLVPTANPSTELIPEREEELRDRFGDLTVAGEPRYYYLRESRVLDVSPDVDERLLVLSYPVAGDATTFEVTWFADLVWAAAAGGAPDEEDADSGTVVFAGPERFEAAVVQLARLKCMDFIGGYEDYAVLQSIHDRELETLRERYLWRQEDEPDVVRVTEAF